MAVDNMDFNMLEGGMEIKNTNRYDIIITTVVDHTHPECQIAVNGEPAPFILRARDTIILTNVQPGVSHSFDPVVVKTNSEDMRHKYRDAIDEVTLENC